MSFVIGVVVGVVGVFVWRKYGDQITAKIKEMFNGW